MNTNIDKPIEEKDITWRKQETKECGCIKEHFGFKQKYSSGRGIQTIKYCDLHEERERLLIRLKEIEEELKKKK